MPKKTPVEQSDFDAGEMDSISMEHVPEKPIRRPLPHIVPMVGVLLLCSVSFNVWVWASAAKQHRLSSAKEAKLLNKLTTSQALLIGKEPVVASLEEQVAVMKIMLGGGGALTAAEVNELAQSERDDPQMNAIYRHYKHDMSLFAPDFPGDQRNYHTLAAYLKKQANQQAK